MQKREGRGVMPCHIWLSGPFSQTTRRPPARGIYPFLAHAYPPPRRRGYWVYDFALPLLIIHAFHFASAEALKGWLAICPRRQITCLDTHDGMGVDDIQVGFGGGGGIHSVWVWWWWGKEEGQHGMRAGGRL